MTHRSPEEEKLGDGALQGLAASLVAAEREVPAAPPEARERVWARVEATLAAQPAAGAPDSPGGMRAVAADGALGLKVFIGLAVVAVAVGAFFASRSEDAAQQPTTREGAEVARSEGAEAGRSGVPGGAPVSPRDDADATVQKNWTITDTTPEKTPETKDLAQTDRAIVQKSETIAPVETPKPPPAGTGAQAPRPVSDPIAERALLDRAQAALRAKKPVDLFLAVNEHAERFPRGALTEEREALRIRGLVEVGDREAARGRAERFRKRYPKSIYGAALDALGL